MDNKEKEPAKEPAKEPEKKKDVVMYTLEEYQKLSNVSSGRVAGIKVWKEAKLEPKSRKAWEQEFNRFTKRKIR